MDSQMISQPTKQQRESAVQAKLMSAKGKSSTRYGFLVDMKRCMGCFTCAMACRSYYQQPLGVVWRKVYPVSTLIYPYTERAFMSLACNHCEEPACAAACPAKAYHIEPDGLVVQDQNKCIGCSNCIRSCPYGAPRFNPVLKKAEKCNLCIERLEVGLMPVCVQSCPVSAIRLVDLWSEEGESELTGTVQFPAGYPMMPQLNPSTRFLQPTVPKVIGGQNPLWNHIWNQSTKEGK